MKRRLVIGISMLACACLLAGCKSSSLKLTTDGSEKSFEPTFGVRSATTKTFSEPDGKGGFKSTKASAHGLYLTNFAPKAEVKMLSDKTVPTADGNIRVVMSFIGPEGTEAGAPNTDVLVAAGTYSAKAARFQKVESIYITEFANGKPKEVSFDRDKADGTVKITSVEADMVAGEIDLRDGKSSIVGSFKTKMQKP